MFKSKQDAADTFASIRRHLPHIAARVEADTDDKVGRFINNLRKGAVTPRDKEALDAVADAMDRQRRKS